MLSENAGDALVCAPSCVCARVCVSCLCCVAMGAMRPPGVPTPTAGVTGMMVTVRVADLGVNSTMPKAKPS